MNPELAQREVRQFGKGEKAVPDNLDAGVGSGGVDDLKVGEVGEEFWGELLRGALGERAP